MNSEKATDSNSQNASDKQPVTEEDYVRELGRLGFGIEDVATYLEVPVQSIAGEWKEKKGKWFQQWNTGRLQGLVSIRKTVMDSALNASTPMISRMLEEYDKSERANQEIWEED
jgi:hypothetical protein